MIELKEHQQVYFDEIQQLWFIRCESVGKKIKGQQTKLAKKINQDADCNKIGMTAVPDSDNRIVLLEGPNSKDSFEQLKKIFNIMTFGKQCLPRKYRKLFKDESTQVLYLHVSQDEGGNSLRRQLCDAFRRKQDFGTITTEYDDSNKLITIEVDDKSKIAAFCQAFFASEPTPGDLPKKTEAKNILLAQQFNYCKTRNLFYIIFSKATELDAAYNNSKRCIEKNLYGFGESFEAREEYTKTLTMVFYPKPTKTAAEIIAQLNEHLLTPMSLDSDTPLTKAQFPGKKVSLYKREWFFDDATGERFIFVGYKETAKTIQDQVRERLKTENFTTYSVGVEKCQGDQEIIVIREIAKAELARLDEWFKEGKLTQKSKPPLMTGMKKNIEGQYYYDSALNLLYTVDKQSKNLRDKKLLLESLPFNSLFEEVTREKFLGDKVIFKFYPKPGVQLDTQENWETLGSRFKRKIETKSLREYEASRGTREVVSEINKEEKFQFCYDDTKDIYFLVRPKKMNAHNFIEKIQATALAQHADIRLCGNTAFFQLKAGVEKATFLQEIGTPKTGKVDDKYQILYEVPGGGKWYFMVGNYAVSKNLWRDLKDNLGTWVREGKVTISRDRKNYEAGDANILIIESTQDGAINSKAIMEKIGSIIKCERKPLPLLKATTLPNSPTFFQPREKKRKRDPDQEEGYSSSYNSS